MAAAGEDCACLSVESKPLRSGGHWAQRDAAAAVPVADGVLLGEAAAWEERSNGADDGGKRARPGVRLLIARDRPHTGALGRLDADGYHGKVRQDGAARATPARAAVDRRQRPVWCSCGNPQTHAVDDPPACDPFLWCMHDGRIVDPRKVCSHSMHTQLKKAARAWQWRRVALQKGLGRGAVVAPLFAVLYSSR